MFGGGFNNRFDFFIAVFHCFHESFGFCCRHFHEAVILWAVFNTVGYFNIVNHVQLFDYVHDFILNRRLTDPHVFVVYPNTCTLRHQSMESIAVADTECMVSGVERVVRLIGLLIPTRRFVYHDNPFDIVRPFESFPTDIPPIALLQFIGIPEKPTIPAKVREVVPRIRYLVMFFVVFVEFLDKIRNLIPALLAPFSSRLRQFPFRIDEVSIVQNPNKSKQKKKRKQKRRGAEIIEVVRFLDPLPAY
ncbi:hypothetical protein SPFM10_00149 [Salmonella phage SPFM10]|nr:hypothetical protein SPFM10_00149 [Salmonella phage SPFM10]